MYIIKKWTAEMSGVFVSAKQIIHCISQKRWQHSVLKNLMGRDRILISEEMKLKPFIFTFSPSIPGIPRAPEEPFSPFCPGSPGILVWHTLQAFCQHHIHTHTHSKVQQSNFLSFNLFLLLFRWAPNATHFKMKLSLICPQIKERIRHLEMHVIKCRWET